jgi:hypothetical protein
MNYEVMVDLLDAIAFLFVTPELLGEKIQHARLRVSESRMSNLIRRAVLYLNDPTRRTLAEAVE